MKGVLRLNASIFSKLHIDFIPGEKWDNADIFPCNQTIDYDLKRHIQNPRDFCLTLKYKQSPHEKKQGYLIDAELSGYFEFPEEYTEEEMQGTIRVNGLTILYGILRGQLAIYTASFPLNAIMLSTVSMYEVVNQIEKNRQSNNENQNKADLKNKLDS